MRRMHALMLPFPVQGHINPLLQLAQHLASSHHFLITFVNTDYNHARMLQANNNSNNDDDDNMKLHQQAEAHLPINMVSLSDGLPLDADRKTSDMRHVVNSMPLHMMPLLEQLISTINQTSDPITCIVADIFMPWVHDVTQKANIHTVLGFYASSISQFSFFYHIPLLISTGQLYPDGLANENLDRLKGIPGLSDIPVTNLSWFVGDADKNKSLFNFLTCSQEHVKQCDAILLNSYSELEKEAMDAFVEETNMKIAPVGPLLLLNRSTHETCTYNVASNGGLLAQDKDCLNWLDGKPACSVLYIAFGTTAWLSMKELHELALGVEASQVTFLWVLRTDIMDAGYACLPEGFLERTKEHAYVTTWAPQPLVLSHASIGAFLTHGGWNSTMEAICMGVPMLTWPYILDQRGNCEQIVEEWKVGLRMRRSDGKVVEKQEVENLVRCIMSGEEGTLLKERMDILKNKARLAVAKDFGSSYNNLQEIVQVLERKANWQRILVHATNCMCKEAILL